MLCHQGNTYGLRSLVCDLHLILLPLTFNPAFLHASTKVSLSNSDAASMLLQRAKKVVSDSPGLVDFFIGLVNSVFNLPDGQVIFFEEFE